MAEPDIETATEDTSPEKVHWLKKYWKGILVVVLIGGFGIACSTVLRPQIVEGIQWFNEAGAAGAATAWFVIKTY